MKFTNINLLKGYSITKFTEKDLENMINLMVKEHFCKDHPDGTVYANFSSKEGVTKLLNLVKKHNFGEFNPKTTFILKKNKNFIGFCILTKLTNNNGCIPEILLSRNYRGENLGKKLIINSMQQFFQNNEDSENIELTATMANNIAANL